MKIDIEKNGETQSVKERYLQNFLDRGWTIVKSKKTKPAVKVEAAAEVKPVVGASEDWDINSEDWADSEESMINNEQGE